MKQHIKRVLTLKNNKETLYGVLWGQFSHGLQESLKTEEVFEAKSKDFDCVWLLEKAKLVSSGVDSRANKHATLVKALTSLCNIKQGSSETNDSYRKRINAYALTLKLAGGEHVLWSPTLIEKTDKTKPPTDDDKKKEIEKFKAMLMILCADSGRYGHL